MKKIFLVASVLFCQTVFVAAKKEKKEKPSLASMIVTQNDSLSYALGQSYSQNMTGFLEEEGISTSKDNYQEFERGLRTAIDSLSPSQKSYVVGAYFGESIRKVLPQFETEILDGEKVDKDILYLAVLESLSGATPIIPNAQSLIQESMQQKQVSKSSDRIAAEKKILEENKMQEGVVSLPSGLQYKIMEEGKGPKPSANDNVTVHYEGRLLNGTVFDSSLERGEPATFPLGSVIKGWTEILQLMPVGSRWTVYIPQELAYGSADMGKIPPFSTLVFDIQLIDINK